MNRTARRAAAVASAVLALTLASCSSPPSQGSETPTVSSAGATATPSEARAILADFGYADLDAKTVVNTLDALPVADRPAGLIASVRPHALALTAEGGREASMPLPDDEFYLSIAPYLSSTHDCHFHSLTTCRGEMSNATMDVTVRDQATGKVLAEGDRTTFDNGFFGLWLPRGTTATITIDHQGRQATATVSTAGDEDATCLTTMQLT